MKNFLAFLAALVVVVGGLGWYLGWFQVTSTPLANGQKRVTVDINTDKVKSDVKKGSEKVIEKGKDAIDHIVDEAGKKGSSAVKKEVGDVFDGFKMPATEEPSEPLRVPTPFPPQ